MSQESWRSTFAAYYHFQTLPSTQRFILEHDQLKNSTIFCRSNVQSAGLGQRGPSWQHTPGQLSFSFSQLLDGPSALHLGLTQLVALTVIDYLNLDGLQLKWPNDIYCQGQKLMGCLIDLVPQGANTVAVIGIGLNLQSQGDFAGLGALLPINASQLLDLLMAPLLKALDEWRRRPYLPLNHRWRHWDCFYGRDAQLDNGQHRRLHAIDQKGRLIVAGPRPEYLSGLRILDHVPAD